MSSTGGSTSSTGGIDCNDADADGFGVGVDCGVEDCDDSDPFVYPGAPFDYPDDGVDDDCMGGDVTRSDTIGVFVDPAGGSEGAAGTMADPLDTLEEAIDLATATDRAVFAAAGVYDEPNLDVVVSLFGGYDPASGWSRDPQTYVTRLTPSGGIWTVRAGLGAQPYAIEGLTIDGSTSGIQSIAVLVFEGATAHLAHNRISGGDATSSSYGISVSDGFAEIIENDISSGSANFSYAVLVLDSARLLYNRLGPGIANNNAAGVFVSYNGGLGNATIAANVIYVVGSQGTVYGVRDNGTSAILSSDARRPARHPPCFHSLTASARSRAGL
ncbi:MAG: hypothetical protein JKY37_27335 [Nannocystaceae bacterium]|nr:hypothetical protein [Nannocystaceae bacterium]